MLSQNSKDKRVGQLPALAQRKSLLGIAGKGSCLGLILLGLILVNPVSSSAYAEEGSNGEGTTTNLAASETDDAGISPQSVLTTSSVSFAFGNPVGITSLTPTTASGASAKYSVKATVDVTNSGGYTVYIGSNKSELTGKNTGTTINSVTSSTSYDNLPLNSWGYNASEGDIAQDSFSAIPINNRGIVIGSNNATNIKSDSKTFTLSFAAHIGNDKPADTYENTITMSVVSSPLDVVFSGIDNLQDMTSSICSTATIGDTKQLKDIRDGKYYWVAKLADNNCWMTQNLALDIGSEWPDASLSDYTVASTEYKPVPTENERRTSLTDLNGTHSWDFGEYVLLNPTTSSDCGFLNYNLSTCPGQVVSVTGKTPSTVSDFYERYGATVVGNEYDAHYLIGNYYQWNTVTAGTGSNTADEAEAQSSICPKGWRLPTANNANIGSFQGLVTAGNIGTNVAKLTSAPYYFVRGGIAYPDAERLLSFVGNTGRYWTSTAVSSSAAYRITYGETNDIAPASADVRSYGNTTRCVAR